MEKLMGLFGFSAEYTGNVYSGQLDKEAKSWQTGRGSSTLHPAVNKIGHSSILLLFFSAQHAFGLTDVFYLLSLSLSFSPPQD